MLGGLFIWFSKRTRSIFGVYALALLPIFSFNYWCVFGMPVFPRWIALDFGANAAMVGLSLWGWRGLGQFLKVPTIANRTLKVRSNESSNSVLKLLIENSSAVD